MTSGRCRVLAQLPPGLREVLSAAPRGVLSTLDLQGRPHAVPVIYAVYGEDLVTPIDHKPKTGRMLARLRNLQRDPRATLLVDRWSEEWTELAWVMIRGRAFLQEAERSAAEIEAIVARYPGHEATIEGSAIIRISPEEITWWSWS